MEPIRWVEIDDRNVGHVTQHGVTIQEIEAVFRSRPPHPPQQGWQGGRLLRHRDGNPCQLPVSARRRQTDQCMETEMNRDVDELTDAELAEWQYAHREELDAEDGELADIEIAPELSVSMSFRLPGHEADAIRSASAASGLTMSDWIRRACASALDDERLTEPGWESAYEKALVGMARAMEELGRLVRSRDIARVQSKARSIARAFDESVTSWQGATRSAEGSIHVMPSEAGWRVVRKGQRRAIARIATKADAVKRARAIARKEGVELVLHEREGRVKQTSGEGTAAGDSSVHR